MDMTRSPAVILDCGSSWCRTGFSSQPFPQVMLQTIIGQQKNNGSSGSKSITTHFIGEKALARRDHQSIKYPMQFGYVQDWDSMELLWQDMLFEKLHCEPENHPFIVALKELSPSQHHEQILQILFENYCAPYVLINSASTLSLRANGHATGVVVDLGESDCIPAPVYNGYTLRHTIQRTMISGSSLTTYLLGLLSQRGILDSHLSTHRAYAKDIKEQLCHVALNYESDMKASQEEVPFMLPDGREITLGKERIQCPEGLFQQNLLDFEMPGLGQCVFRAMKACDENVQPELFSNVVLCGGSSFFPGLSVRLHNELQCLADNDGFTHQIKVTHCPHRHAAFYGASLVASDDKFLSMCVSKEFYNENGPMAARKFLLRECST